VDVNKNQCANNNIFNMDNIFSVQSQISKLFRKVKKIHKKNLVSRMST